MALRGRLAEGGDGAFSMLLYELASRDASWAGCYAQPDDDEFQVVQYGDRCLWDEVEAAFLRWLALGAPGADRFGLTVTAGGEHRLWVDAPDRVVSALC